MQSSDSFLRRLPMMIEERDRLRLEALVFTQDRLEAALERLKRFASSTEKFQSSLDRASLFSDAWTIVDQVHTARLLLSSLTGDDRKTDTQAFLDDFADARELRNEMAHLDQKLPNRASSNLPAAPFFGMISFFRPANQAVELMEAPRQAGTFFCFQVGSFWKSYEALVNLPQFNNQLPANSFLLQAFGYQLRLERPVEALRPIMDRIAAHTETQCMDRIEDAVIAMGLTREEVLKSRTFDVVVGIEFGPATEGGAVEVAAS